MIKNKNIYRKEETLMAQLWGGRFTKEISQKQIKKSKGMYFHITSPNTLDK